MNQKEIITKKTLQEFGVIFGLGLPLIIGWLIPFLFGHSPRAWTLFFGIPTLILSIICPRALQLPYKIWIKIGIILGWINSKIILGIVFFVILIPISLIMKTFKYDPLKKNLLKNQISYREITKNNKIDLTKIF